MKITRTTWALATYVVVVFAFRISLERSAVGQALGVHLRFAFASFALLLVPLWFFGFGAGDWLRQKLPNSLSRVLAPALLGVPYLLFALHIGHFAAPGITMFVLPIALAALLELSVKDAKMAWQDVFALGILVGIYMLHHLEHAWPYEGLAALPKLYVIDLAIYLYAVVRTLDGMGYSLAPQPSAILIGLREWIFFLPFGVGLGFALHFIHWHPRIPSVFTLGAPVFVTCLLVALPEELFFRAILQNLLETRMRPAMALAIAAILFGLGHFNKGAALNWRYVLLAAIAGVFYGRAWRARRQVLASVITHTAVDVVWALWFR